MRTGTRRSVAVRMALGGHITDGVAWGSFRARPTLTPR
jgi:hypothetical protein